ncbi:MAG TPA: DUF945 family protein [Malonomonas sp.]
MRKLVASLLILPLLLLFGVLYYNSIKTEETYRAQLEQLNQNYPGLLRLQLVDYQRGLLESKAQLALQLQNQPPLDLTQQIQHLFWGLTITTRLAEESPLAKRLAARLPLADLQLITEVKLSGASQTSFALPFADFEIEEGRLSFKNLNFNCRMNGQLSSAEIDFQLGALELQEQQSSLRLSGLALTSQLSELQGLPLGGGELTLAHLSVAAADQPAFDLKGLRYQVASRLDGEKFSSALALTLAELELLNEKFRAAELKLTLAGIDAATLRNVQQSAQQLQADLLEGQVDPLLLKLQLFGLYAQLLRDGTSLQLERLALQAEDGGLQGRGGVSLVGTGPLSFERLKAELLFDLDSGAFAALFRLFDSLQRQGQPAQNRAVLTEQAEQLAGAFIQKGLLSRREDGGYRSELKIEQGNAELNGTPFRL